MKTIRLFAAATLLLGLLGGGAAIAQESTDSTVPDETATSVASESTPGPLEIPDGASIRIRDVNLTRFGTDGQVTLTVALQGLSDDVDLEQVVVTENGQPVEGAQMALGQFEAIPAFVALVIDTSGSMETDGRLEAAKAAAVQFVEQKEPEDFVALVTFNDNAEVVREFNSSPETVIEAINALVPQGGTAMFDGIVAATDLFGTAPDGVRRNMIVLTDGEPDGGGATAEEAIAAVQREDVRAFGVAIQSGEFEPVDLESIAQSSGGLLLQTTDPDELSALYSQIQRELNRALLIRFNSSEVNPVNVDFGVSYGTLVDSVNESVPGFVTATSRVDVSTTTTVYQLAQVETAVVSYDLPLDSTTIILLATLGIGGAVLLFLYILLGNENDGAARFGKRLAAYGRRGGLAEEKRPLLERIPLLNRFTAAAEEQVRKRGLLGAVNATLEQGNVPLSAGEAIAAGMGLAAVFGLIAGVVSLNPVVGGVVFVVAVMLVFAIINFIGKREKKKFEKQLPDTLTLISTSLRAGYSLLQAVEAVAQEAPNPTAREFGRAIAEARLGRQVTDALAGVTDRTQSKDFEWAVMAIDIQREVGGNLAEVLQTVADTMLARNRLRGEINALTAEGRISAIVLGGLPFAIGTFLWLSNPDYLRPLFQSTSGLIGVGMGGALMTAGIFWLRKIVNIEV